MKTTYTLYHNEKPTGQLLATVTDQSQCNVLEGYYFTVYNNENFRVTMKRPRRQEEWLCGQWHN